MNEYEQYKGLDIPNGLKTKKELLKILEPDPFQSCCGRGFFGSNGYEIDCDDIACENCICSVANAKMRMEWVRNAQPE